MKIAIIIRIAWPIKGGLTWHALRLAQNLIECGHEVECFTRFTKTNHYGTGYFSYHEKERTFICEGVPTHVIGCNKLEKKVLTLVARLRTRALTLPLAKKIVEEVFIPKFSKKFSGFDVVHYDGGGEELLGFAAMKAAKKKNIPFLVQPSIHFDQWGNLPIDHNFYNCADGVLVHTKAEQDYLLDMSKLHDKPIYVVGNGVDLIDESEGYDFRQKYNIHGKMVLFLGRKSHDKGYYLVHEAFQSIAKEYPDLNAVFIGPDEKDCELVRVHMNHPGKGRILELGFVDDVERNAALLACDFLCVPSRGESFGLVFMEAALCSKPSIASNLAVVDELLGPDGIKLIGERLESGQVKLTSDDVALAISELMDRHEELSRIAIKASEYAKKHLWKYTIKRFIDVYDITLHKCSYLGCERVDQNS